MTLAISACRNQNVIRCFSDYFAESVVGSGGGGYPTYIVNLLYHDISLALMPVHP